MVVYGIDRILIEHKRAWKAPTRLPDPATDATGQGLLVAVVRSLLTTVLQ